MISYHFVPISSQKGVLFLRHPVERNKNYGVNQERCTTSPQSSTKEPPTDSHNSSGIDDASKRLKQSYAQAAVRNLENMGRIGHVTLHHEFPSKQHPSPTHPLHKNKHKYYKKKK